ncbi:MAG: hypothetical protein WDN04_21345 [Rhodospirillales bacterium]
MPVRSAATAACRARNWQRHWTHGITATGIDVIELGLVTTPMTYFAAHHLDATPP